MTEVGNEVVWSDHELHDTAASILAGEYDERGLYLVLRSIRDLKRGNAELEAARVKVFALAGDVVRDIMGIVIGESKAGQRARSLQQAIADYDALAARGK